VTLKQSSSPSFVQVEIKGPVLLLMGPIGLFFSRFYHYLRDCGIPAFKVEFPLYEFGFPARVPAVGVNPWGPQPRRSRG